MQFLLLVFILVIFQLIIGQTNNIRFSNFPYCREPNGEIPSDQRLSKNRKYMLFGGEGAGIGNFIIFFPAAFYLAALTGREIIIVDSSLLGEMCRILHCGFPLLSDMRLGSLFINLLAKV